jgi:hypothetical protein
MSVSEQVAKLCQGLPPDKQEEVLDFVEFLVSRQSSKLDTPEETRGRDRHDGKLKGYPYQ